MGKFLKRQEDGVREAAIEDAGRLLNRIIGSQSMHVVLQMGREGSVAPPVFKRVFRAALRDPEGEGLVRHMADEMGLEKRGDRIVATKDTANMAAYYRLFTEMRLTKTGMSEVGRSKYQRVFDFFEARSMGDPAFPDRSVKSILGSKAFDLTPLRAVEEQ